MQRERVDLTGLWREAGVPCDFDACLPALNAEGPITDTDRVKAVLYSMQVDNPRPDVPIKSIDVEPGRRGNR